MLTGRFAPSPTGPLHMGSLITAVASYLDIKSQGGRWYVRIDNLDPPREDPSATTAILAGLQAHGLQGDLPIDYQSDHSRRYEQALEQLAGHLFYCTCSRRTLAGLRIYPGTCRNSIKPIEDAAIRVRTSTTSINYTDAMLGEQQANLAEDYGDFVVKRRDGLWAYNFATAIDDGHDCTHVVRGQDLLHVTPQQIYVMQMLDLPVPAYMHIPLLCFKDGAKLSKQSHAPPLDNEMAGDNLRSALDFLGMHPPIADWSPAAWLNWALDRWPDHQLPPQLAPFVFN